MNPARLLVLLISLPLLLGGCGEKPTVKPVAEVKTVKEEVLNLNEEIQVKESITEVSGKNLENKIAEVDHESDLVIAIENIDSVDSKFKIHDRKIKYQVQDGQVIIKGYDEDLSGDLIIPSVIEDKPVISIGERAFSFCKTLRSVAIPDSVVSIGEDAFTYCDNLEIVTIPDSVKIIGLGAFGDCASLKEVEIPHGVTTILPLTFKNCRSLTRVSIPNSVKSIEGAAFQSCKMLMHINIPDSVTTIGESAFFLCSNLDDVIIPASVTTIGAKAFILCNKLKSITFLGDPPKINGKGFFGPSQPTIYRKAEAKGWESTWQKSPVKLISEKP